MPKVKPTASEDRRNKLSARIQYQMAKAGFDNKKMAKLINVSERTFIEKKLHAPDEFTLAEIWAMEKAFGCELSVPVRVTES